MLFLFQFSHEQCEQIFLTVREQFTELVQLAHEGVIGLEGFNVQGVVDLELLEDSWHEGLIGHQLILMLQMLVLAGRAHCDGESALGEAANEQ